jgi:hypothetical protein
MGAPCVLGLLGFRSAVQGPTSTRDHYTTGSPCSRSEEAFGTLTEGQSKSFAAAKKLWLRLSKPQNVQLVLNGEMQDADAEGPSILVATAGGLRVLAT